MADIIRIEITKKQRPWVLKMFGSRDPMHFQGFAAAYITALKKTAELIPKGEILTEITDLEEVTIFGKLPKGDHLDRKGAEKIA